MVPCGGGPRPTPESPIVHHDDLDDRDWRAEDLLKQLVEGNGGGTPASPVDRIAAFLDANDAGSKPRSSRQAGPRARRLALISLAAMVAGVVLVLAWRAWS